MRQLSVSVLLGAFTLVSSTMGLFDGVLEPPVWQPGLPPRNGSMFAAQRPPSAARRSKIAAQMPLQHGGLLQRQDCAAGYQYCSCKYLSSLVNDR
jgi:hypothetical protein